MFSRFIASPRGLKVVCFGGLPSPGETHLITSGYGMDSNRPQITPANGHQGMLLAPFIGIPYNPRVLNRQLPLDYVCVFVDALEKFAEEAGSR
jgi:hypothetical protein